MPVLNPSFELPGADPGDALDWTFDFVSTAVEYATFEKATAAIPTTLVPTETPLGVELILDPSGSTILFVATDVEEASEDMEEGWLSNEDFLFEFMPANLEFARFDLLLREAFEPGWDNDPGLLDNFDAIASEAASFDTAPEEFEDFAADWPAGSSGIPITAYEPLDMGSWNQATQAFTDGGDYTAPEAATSLVAVVTSAFTTTAPQGLNVAGLDGDGFPYIASLTVPRAAAVGTRIVLVPPAAGVRTIVSVVVDPSWVGGTGSLRFDGDPGPDLEHASVTP
jgi:hypothetical protein